MKFARYLEETQTPEWKRAYIDYRKLKKRISAIRNADQGFTESPVDSPIGSRDHLPLAASNIQSDPDYGPYDLTRHSVDTDPSHPRVFSSSDGSHTEPSQPPQNRTSDVTHDEPLRPAVINRRPPIRGSRQSFAQRLSIRGQSVRRTLSGFSIPQSRLTNPLIALPLHDLLASLTPRELVFFTTLDAELDKIETFYLDREKEMHARTVMLREQLDELSDHRKLFHKAHDNSQPWSSALTSKLHFGLRHLKKDVSVDKLELKGQNAGQDHVPESSTVVNDEGEHVTEHLQPPDERFKSQRSSGLRSFMASVISAVTPDVSESDADKEKELGSSGVPADPPTVTKQGVVRSTDPDDYLYAKKKLKKAVLEHYRGLEVLHNYRILNVTGFRKALKKFEKVTKIPVQKEYMAEKVEKSSLASDKTVRDMMKELEDMYATMFVHGDKKKATHRLRAGSSMKSHHFSTFRSGIFLGIALPAFIAGLYLSFQESTREAIPGWDALLFLYGVLLVPVLFTILVGVNLLVWSRARINYVFIFELDVRTRLDHREYFETPCMLLAGLSYAFWLSFARIGAPSASPTIWPLVWLGFVAIVMIDPFPILFKPSRYWLIKNVSKLLISGSRRVEFTDFWMGDQFCSLIFSLSNLYLFVCVYVEGFDDEWQKCGAASRNWPVAFALAALPLLVRLVQSIKRYADSKLITHLINGGKYASGILSYLFYYIWRHQGSSRDAHFALWCIFNAHYSLYALSWDLLMDWSLLRPHAKFPLLRPELAYSNNVPLYYFAIVSNVILRFIWVFYIPKNGPSANLRSFILGVLEILRRWQWNFYRLENEHLGNMDQYRVTREVPLPYSFDDVSHEDDADDADDTDGVRPKGKQ